MLMKNYVCAKKLEDDDDAVRGHGEQKLIKKRILACCFLRFCEHGSTMTMIKCECYTLTEFICYNLEIYN